MFFMQWSIVVLVVLVSLVAWYLQMKIHENLEEFNVSNTVFSGWVFNPSALNAKGQFYRKNIFICW